MQTPPPPQLGRGVVLGAGDAVPVDLADAPEVVVDGAALEHPATVVEPLHEAWLRRRPVVIRLLVDAARLREPATLDGPVWSVGHDLELWGDRLHFLLWANNRDGRDGRDPVWWWGRLAERLGAVRHDGPEGDVRLPDGTVVWVDGGPRGAVAGLAAPLVHRESIDAGRLAVDRHVAAPPPGELADDQRAAVLHDVGPARVIAPAGSGKTRVLTERLRTLHGARGLGRADTVAVAYNRRAQAELQQRTAEFGPRVETLNALGYGVLSRALGARPPVLGERDVRRIIEGLVPVRRRRANTDPIAPYLEALGQVRLGLRDPAEVEAARDDVEGLAEAFAPYRLRLREAGAVDFDEQVYGAVELLLRDGALRRAEQARHRRMLVDEFQDLTPAHVLLIRLLATPELEVFGVGDDDQVIYGHAGATPRFLIDFAAAFPGATEYELHVNYRSPPDVLRAATALLGYNRRRVPKTIRSGRPDAPEGLRVLEVEGEDSAAQVVRLAAGWLAAGVAPGDIAVLTRVNAQLLAPQVALTQAGVPVATGLDAGVLERTGVRAALAYLRIATSPEGFSARDVIEVLRRPSRGFPIWVERWFRGERVTVDAVRATARRMDDARVAQKVLGLADDLQAVVDAAAGGTTRRVLQVVREVVGLEGAMELLDARGSTGASHLDDLDALAQVADLHPDPGGFEPWLRDTLTRAATSGGVTLATVHRVKGQEWDRVVVFGVAAGVFPHRLADDIEEERRVMHVAITRGRRDVVVLGDRRRPSPFLPEMAGTAPHTPAAPAAAPPTPRATPARPAPPPDAPLDAAATAVEERLRGWRAERARRDGVPAYVVLHDRHLRDIARRGPQDARQLAACAGMGPTRLERYGDEILGVLTAGD
ncbi:MAG: ATP-dependent DNA helicase UvrD2 [Thermoleophilia bacterium]